MWSRNFSNCIECNTEVWNHKGKGYCEKCYPLKKSIKTINSWNIKNHATLKTVGPFNLELILSLQQKGILAKAIHNYEQGIAARLDLLKICNFHLNVTTTQLEFLFERVAAITNNINQKKLFNNSCKIYSKLFTQKQIQQIASDLALILVNRRLKINIWEGLITK